MRKSSLRGYSDIYKAVSEIKTITRAGLDNKTKRAGDREKKGNI